MAASEPSESAVEVARDPARRPAERPSPLRTVAPFVVAVLLLGLVASRVDPEAFKGALAQLRVAPFVVFVAVWGVSLLAADALGNFAAYRLTMPGVRWSDFFVFRGASYLPAVLNHHLGQAYMTYLLARLGRIPLLRMAGATLVSYATWMGCLLGCVAVALPFSDLPATIVPAIVGAGLLYLVVIGWRPSALANVAFLAPLFEAGVRGHAIGLVARLPHLAVLVLGNWGAFLFFGVHLPLGTALVYLPILLVATTLPITPQGFGTRDTLAALFFLRFADGATDAERLGRLAACTTVWGVGQTLIAIVIAMGCARVVQRRLRAKDDEESAGRAAQTA